MKFDLTIEPWIPGRTERGVLERFTLRDVLVQAHTLIAVEHPVPIIEAGLLRLLVAVVLDALQPRSLDDLLTLRDRRRFDESAVDGYLERYRDAFDLFSAKRPFLQDSSAGGEEKSVAALLPAQPVGTFVSHWHHVPETDFAVCPAEAAALLTAVAPFMTAGGKGLAPSINGAPPWYVMLAGPTLFHTIVLNLWVDRPSAVRLGTPAWRRAGPLETMARRTSSTLLEALTWQPRRIRLVPGPGGRCSLGGEASAVLVSTMYFAKGESCDFPWTDPNVAYVFGKDGKRLPVRPRDGQDPWRDVAALALLNDTSQDESARRIVRPAVVSQLEDLCRRDESMADEELGLLLYGMRTDLKMKVYEWVKQTLRLPVPLYLDRELARLLVSAVRTAEHVQQVVLRRALVRAVSISQHEPEGEAKALLREAARSFWGALETHFHALAGVLGSLDPERDAAAVAAALDSWQNALANGARGAFTLATDRLRRDAAHVLTIEAGRALLDRDLRRLAGSPLAHAG